MGLVLVIIGLLIAVVGGIWFLVVAFQESVLWGLGCLLFGPIGLVFLIMHWQVAKKPFLVEVLGFALMVVGMILSPEQVETLAPPQ